MGIKERHLAAAHRKTCRSPPWLYTRVCSISVAAVAVVDRGIPRSVQCPWKSTSDTSYCPTMYSTVHCGSVIVDHNVQHVLRVQIGANVTRSDIILNQKR